MNKFRIFLELLELVYIASCAANFYNKRIWVRELFSERNVKGFFASTFQTLKNKDPEQFFLATRMQPEVFDVLFTLLKHKLEKNSARAIPADCRLFLTIVYLAHGTSRQFLSLTFRMSVSVIRRIVMEVCDIIWQELSQFYLSQPNLNEWERIAEDFKNIWDLPNCIGAIDGKHVNITCPPNSGSMYYNYKGTYSIVLLGICDANYTFTAVDIGAFGSQSDGGVLTYSEIGKRLFSEKLEFPPNALLPNSNVTFPHYLVGDAAFPLKPFLMRPFPGVRLSEKRENFNKRLSRARRTIENTFGILTARWRILRGTLNMSPHSAEKIVGAAVVMHNFLKMNDGKYCPPSFIDHDNDGTLSLGLWRTETTPLQPIRRFSSNNSSRNAFDLRETLADYLLFNKI